MSKIKRNESELKLEKELELDKNAIISDIKKQAQEELLKEISMRVDYETKNSLEKIEKRIYRYKNIQIFKRNIIIILLFLLCLFEAKILFDNDLILNHKKNNSQIVDVEDKKDEEKDMEEEKEIEVIKNKEWYIEKYSYLLNNIKTNIDNNDYLYKGNYDESNIDLSIKLNMAYQLIKNNININEGILSFSDIELKNAYIKIFGISDNYFNNNFNDDCIQFIYNENLNKYMAIDNICVDNETEIVKKIIDIYEENDDIIIEIVAGIHNKVNNYLTNINGTVLTKNYESIDSYLDKLNSYKYVFYSIDDDYYLKEIIKIK